MKRIHLTCMILIVLSMACSSPREKAESAINELNEELYSDTINILNTEKARELMEAYIDYVDKFPESEKSPDYLFKSGELAMNAFNGILAVKIFERILNDYPDYEKAPESLFLMGFTFEERVENLDKAREVYQQFIDTYPDHEFTDDARLSIENLGVSPEELIKQFEVKNKEEATPDSIAS